MHIAPAERFRIHLFPRCGLYEGRAAEEDRPLVPDDDGFVAHGGDIGAPRGAGSHDHSNLSDASSRQLGLVIEDAAEVVPIREYLGLEGQERAAGIYKVNARQSVFQRDFLGSQMLFHGDGIIGAALHRSVVSDDYAEATSYLTNARNEASAEARLRKACARPMPS